MTTTGQGTDERFDEAVVELLAERGRTTNGDIRAALDGIPDLPDRAGGTRSWVAAVAAVAVLAVAGALALGRLPPPGIGNATDRVGRTAFAGDPRLADCEAQNGTAAQVFEMIHAEWFPLYFPGWYRGAPELEVADPALVVIGPPVNLPGVGAAPRPDTSGPAPTRPPSVSLCIAVGPPGAATLHQYGPTWFDRIVPVLSDADLARAAHLDPDVLADPAAWPFPERLAPCGGLTGNELYIFETSHLSDLPHYFPSADLGPFPDDDPAVVVVYRDPLPGVVNDVGPSDRPRHDVCLASESAGARPDHVILRGVDLTGFHVRIDRELGGPSIAPPQPTSSPSTRRRPRSRCRRGPAMRRRASSARARLRRSGRAGRRTSTGSAATRARSRRPISNSSAARGSCSRPMDSPCARAWVARLYTYDVVGRTRAVMVVLTDDGTEQGRWLVADVASCDPSEFDPRAHVGGGIHIWTDASGNRVRADEVLQRADCNGGIQLSVRGRLFVRPGSVDPAQLDSTYAASTTLPKDALPLGYLDRAKAMWTAADGKALYIVEGDDAAHAERLPHVKGDEIQRIDCN